MSSRNPLTAESQRSTIATSSTGTSEKIIMETTTEDIVAHVRTWSLDRAADMSVDKEDARAILAEFYEWIEPEGDELEIVSLEPEDWHLININLLCKNPCYEQGFYYEILSAI